jgi:uncharacterized protein YjbI with pentapeptide repeats
MTALTRARFLAEASRFGDQGRCTQFCGRNFRACDLSRLDLRNLLLRDSSLVTARLDHADLTFTDLRGANLSGASLRGANLRHVLIDPAINWQAAIADADTRWPKGFSPAGSGVVVQFTAPHTAQASPERADPTPALAGL